MLAAFALSPALRLPSAARAPQSRAHVTMGADTASYLDSTIGTPVVIPDVAPAYDGRVDGVAGAPASTPDATLASLKALAAAAKDDVRGIVDAGAPNAFLPDSAYWIGVAFRQWLGSSDRVAVGADPRLSSPEISDAFCRGAGACNVGAGTTPVMLESLLAPSSDIAGSVMVTASHLPAEWNGLKFFARSLGRGLNKKEVKEVMALAVELGEARPPLEPKAVGGADGFMVPYVEKLKGAVRAAAGGDDATPLAGMKICVNPGSGAGGFFASEVLAPLGADVSVSINLAPDGNFPAHLPNPEDKAHVAATIDAVAASGADVGVMLDTDVDRCGLIDGCLSPPEPVNRNRLIALCAMDALEAAGGAGVIVTDPVTSTGMGPFIEQRGGVHDRFQMGYRNVIDRAAETTPEPALLAIETSGHSAWRDNAFVDDGCYTAARLIGRLARERRAGSGSEGLLELLGGTLEEPVESIKVKMGVAAGLPGVPAAEEALCAALRRCADAEPTWEIEKVNHDGLRCAAGPDGWLIIRGSLHEPSVSVQTESDVAGGTAAICATLLKYVNEGEGFEVAPLAKAGATAKAADAAAPSGGAAAGGEADFGAPPEGFVWAEGVF